MPKREPIIFEKVETEARWNELELFAASFGHKIDRTSLTPLVAVRRGQKLFAYFFVLQHPVLMPSFHPGYTTPRDFVELVEQARAWRWLSSIGNERYPSGVCWVAFDRDPVISPDLIEKMGFNRSMLELWNSHPEGMAK